MLWNTDLLFEPFEPFLVCLSLELMKVHCMKTIESCKHAIISMMPTKEYLRYTRAFCLNLKSITIKE